jgi:diguanylate cyclase (GGDEF)-like protein
VDTFSLSVGVSAISVAIIVLAIIATVVGRAFQQVLHTARLDKERIIEAIDSLNDGFTLYDDQGSLTMCNRVLHNMYPALASLLRPGTHYKDLVAAWTKIRGEGDAVASLPGHGAGGFFEQPREDRLGDGRWVYIRDHSIGRGGLATVFTDVTPIKELQAIYEKLADQDALTGLVSRRLFEDRIDHAIAIAKRLGTSLSLLYIDLDHFKPINDSLGHEAGDIVLKEIARRLLAAARDSDTVARIGGDEFVVLMEVGSSRAGAEILATRIIDIVGATVLVDGHKCNVGASIGIATLPAQVISKPALIKAADEAMYEAKEAGRGRYRIHENSADVPIAQPAAIPNSGRPQ